MRFWVFPPTILIVLALLPCMLYAQGCLPEGIVFSTQEEINEFATDYPGCTVIEGPVQIVGSVNDLSGLNVVEVFEDDVLIFGSDLINLTGLNEAVKIEGWLGLMENMSLENLDGLQVVDSLPGGMSVMESPAFTSLTGLDNLLFAKFIDLSMNESLVDITALGNLQTIEYDLAFWDNDALVSLEGLENLEYVGHWFYVMHNENISGLNNLVNLTTVGSNFSIINNDALTDLQGLSSELVLEGNLKIKDNDNLTDCAAWSICNYLATPPGEITIENNAAGCNSQEEVEEACADLTSCLPEGITFTSQSDLDNFPLQHPYCSEIEGFLHIIEDSLTSDPITNLLPLSNITMIGGDLKINHTSQLKTLMGLDSLFLVGGNLQVSYNDSLQDVNVLSNLTLLGGGLHFQMNKSLLTLDGLEGIQTVNGDFLFLMHPILYNMDGFQNVHNITGSFSISWLCGMQDLTGFNGLQYIGGDLSVEHLCDVMDLDGFQSIQAIGGTLHINFNDTLSDISGIGAIAPESISGIEIMGNKNLSECHVVNICEFIFQQTGYINIQENLEGCNSPAEVEEACSSCLPDGIVFTSQDQIDQFLDDYPMCSEIEGNVQIVGEEITNLDGLSNITEMQSLLYISETNLQSLQGLDQLSYIGGNLSIGYCPGLAQLTGLENLQTIGGDFHVGFSALTNFEALESLESVGGITLYYTGTTSMDGLEGLTAIGGGLSLDNCFELENVEGLQNLKSINGSLSIFITGLTSLNGLDSINPGSIQNLMIADNEELSTCHVFSVCQYLADPSGYVIIYGNDTGCSTQEEIEDACWSGQEEFYASSGNIVLSPNPATKTVMISSMCDEKVNRVSIMDLSGNTILDEVDPNPFVNIESLSKGLYLVTIHTPGHTYIRKLLVN